MNIIAPILFFLIPILVALWLCEWQVVAAFLIGIFVIPPFLFFLTHLFQVFTEQKRMDLNGLFEVGALFSFAGFPIYFLIILPIYYALKASKVPLVYSFPFCLSVVMFILFVIITEKEWGSIAFFSIVACSIFHALFILWLISRLKSIAF